MFSLCSGTWKDKNVLSDVDHIVETNTTLQLLNIWHYTGRLGQSLSMMIYSRLLTVQWNFRNITHCNVCLFFGFLIIFSLLQKHRMFSVCTFIYYRYKFLPRQSLQTEVHGVILSACCRICTQHRAGVVTQMYSKSTTWKSMSLGWSWVFLSLYRGHWYFMWPFFCVSCTRKCWILKIKAIFFGKWRKY